MKIRQLVFFSALTGCVAILVNVWLNPHIQFTSFNDNNEAVALACLMPTVMAVVGLPVAHLGLRIAFRVGLAALALAGIFACYVVVIGSIVAGGPDLSETISTGRYTLHTYIDFAADSTADSGVVDQVCDIAPGLVFSRHVHSLRGIEMDSVSVLTPSLIRIRRDTVTLRPLLGPLCRSRAGGAWCSTARSPVPSRSSSTPRSSHTSCSRTAPRRRVWLSFR